MIRQKCTRLRLSIIWTYVHMFLLLRQRRSHRTAELSDFSCIVAGIDMTNYIIPLRCIQTDRTLTMEGQV